MHRTYKIKLLLFLVFLSFIRISAKGQTDCSCCTEAHKQFDFWVGEWIVKDTLGNIVGENKITKIEKNCALLEQWTGAKGGTGTSLNYYDKNHFNWNQVWVDASGNILRLKGHLIDGKMVLKDELRKSKKKGKKIKWYYNQISWTPNKDGSVSQLWEVYSKKGKLLKTLFLGIYHKKKK